MGPHHHPSAADFLGADGAFRQIACRLEGDATIQRTGIEERVAIAGVALEPSRMQGVAGDGAELRPHPVWSDRRCKSGQRGWSDGMEGGTTIDGCHREDTATVDAPDRDDLVGRPLDVQAVV